MSLIQIDPLSWIPEATKQQVTDGILDYLGEGARKTLGNKAGDLVAKLKSDAGFQRAVDEGLARGTDRFLREYVEQDEDLVTAIEADRDFWQTRSVRDTLLTILRRPGRWESKDWEAVAERFSDVLPQRRNRERVDRAVRFYLQCIAEELWHLPELRPIYEMQLQRISVDRAQEMVHELHGMRTDLQQALLVLVQGFAEQQKLISSTTPLALAAPPKVYHNLPNRDYGHFVGRERELANLRELLTPDSRAWVIVIDGIGGIGKSALALETAHRHLQEFDSMPEKERFQAIIWTSAKAAVLTADGIAPRQQITRTLEDIYTTIAITLQREDITRARPEEQTQVVCQALTRQRTLLIVDNLETIDDERVNAFLRELPIPTKCIVTTRHRIDVSWAVRLAGMPRMDALALITQESEKKAVSLTSDEADLLFRRTGGVPLAIVWSIAQMGYGYGVSPVLRRLGDATGDINRYSFAGAMEGLGSKPAYRLLMALSLFKTDASRNALEYVAGLAKLDQEDGLVDLERLSLVNKSGDRFWLLPLTRDYARGLLEHDSAVAQDLRLRWVNYYAEFITQRRFGDVSDQQLLEAERENLIEVIEQVWRERQVETRENLLNRFFIFLWRRGYWAEAVRQASRLLIWADQHQQVEWQARFEHWLGRLYLYQGLLAQAEKQLTLASERYGEDAWQWVSVQTYLAQVYLRQDFPSKAEHVLNAALTRATQQEGEPGRGSARIYNVFAEIRLKAGKPAEAQGYLAQALQICDGRIDHVTVLGRTSRLLSEAEMQLSHPQAADTWANKYLELALNEGFVQEIALARFDLAQTRCQLGKRHEARQMAEDAVTLFERLGMKSELEECRRFLAGLSPDS